MSTGGVDDARVPDDVAVVIEAAVGTGGGSGTGGALATGAATGGKGTGGAGTGGTGGSFFGRGGAGAGGLRGSGGRGTGGSGGAAPTGGVRETGGAGGGVAGAGGSTAVGRALRFDGLDDTVTLPASAGAANERAFSVELWFKTTTQTGMMFEVYTPGGGADRSCYFSNGKVCFYVWTPDYSEICTPADVYNDDTWHHLAATLGGHGQILYIDGRVLVEARTVTASAFITDEQFQLGYGHIGPYGPLVYFAGALDEVRIWSVERNSQEIADNYRRSIDCESPGLQGYWPLDQDWNSEMATDAASDPHDGRLVGFSFDPPPWVPGAI